MDLFPRTYRPRTILTALTAATLTACGAFDAASEGLDGSDPLAPRPAPELEAELPDEPREVADWIEAMLMEREAVPSPVPNLDTGAPLPHEYRRLRVPQPRPCPRMPTVGLAARDSTPATRRAARDSIPTVRLDSAGYPIRVAPLCDSTAR